MKKRMVLIPSLALLMLLAVVAPILADSPRKIQVKAVITGKTQEYREFFDTPGGLRHVDLIWTGPIELYIPETSSTPLEGTYTAVINGTRCKDPLGGADQRLNEGVFHFKEVWTFDGGTFEGIAQVKTHGPQWGNLESHIVLQGCGTFATQTLSLSAAIPPGPLTYYGELLVP